MLLKALSFAILINVIKCMRSFSASSNNLRVQLLSLYIRRNARKWYNTAPTVPTVPGTAAVFSVMTARFP